MIKTRTYLIAVAVAFAVAGHAQTWLDYDQALSAYSWLHTTNAATLTTYQPTDSSQRLLADAHVGVSIAQGHLASSNATPESWGIDAAVRSIARMSRRVVLRGAMEYSNTWGHQAGGSVWMCPDDRPFDIIECNDSTRGDIGLERYYLDGEVGVMTVGGLSLGARFAYATASSAKKKDPRHTNTLMQLDVSVGGSWQVDRWRFGANYLLKRTTEALQFSTYGRTDRVYGYLIDQGAAFGRDEQSDGKGYVGSDHEKPWLDMRHGVALQAGFANNPWSAVIEWQWMHRHGHYGLESPSHLDFNRHKGNEWHLRSWWQYATSATIHRITAEWSHETIQDDERTYRIVTTGGVTDINYYDDRQTGEREVNDINITYDAQWGIRRSLATWQAQACLNHYRRSLTASLYPYYRQQLTRLTDIILSVCRNWLAHNDHVWSLAIAAGWSGGGGTPAKDGTYTAVIQESAPVADHNELLMRQYEWFTADRMHGGITMRWSMPLLHQHLRLYAQAGYRIAHAMDVKYLQGSNRHTGTISLGCLF